MKYSALTGFAFAILLAISPISRAATEEGVLLSADDYAFLAAHGIQSNDTILEKMSPKELRHIHDLINDKRTESNPQSKIQAVTDALVGFEGNQRWETENPGRLWDDKTPPAAGGASPK